MATWALIQGGRVAALYTGASAPDESGDWQDVTGEGAELGWPFGGGQVIAPMSLANAKEEKIAEIYADGVARLRTVLGFTATNINDELMMLMWAIAYTLYGSIAIPSRTPTETMEWIWLAWSRRLNAVNAVNAATTVVAVRAVTVDWPA